MVPSHELCLWASLLGTDATWVPAGVRWGVWDQYSGLTDQPEMGQARTSWAPFQTHLAVR